MPPIYGSLRIQLKIALSTILLIPLIFMSVFKKKLAIKYNSRVLIVVHLIFIFLTKCEDFNDLRGYSFTLALNTYYTLFIMN